VVGNYLTTESNRRIGGDLGGRHVLWRTGGCPTRRSSRRGTATSWATSPSTQPYPACLSKMPIFAVSSKSRGDDFLDTTGEARLSVHRASRHALARAGPLGVGATETRGSSHCAIYDDSPPVVRCATRKFTRTSRPRRKAARSARSGPGSGLDGLVARQRKEVDS
jgi:hypothetical protein